MKPSSPAARPRSVTLTIQSALLAAITALSWSSAGQADTGKDAQHTIPLQRGVVMQNGLERDFYYVAPPEQTGPLPVVMVFHGYGGNGRKTLHGYRWDEQALRDGFIAVGMQAVPFFPHRAASFRHNPRIWKSGAAIRSTAHGAYDDLAHIRTVLDYLDAHYPIDRSRIYATGFSNGGGFTHRLGMQMSDVFAAVAPIASHIRVPDRSPKRPLPVLLAYGTEDPFIPYEGGPARSVTPAPKSQPKVSETIDMWVTALGCAPDQSHVENRPRVRIETWSDCAPGATVRAIMVDGLGHQWPGGRPSPLPASTVGPGSDALNLTDEMWSFFKQYRLEPAHP